MEISREDQIKFAKDILILTEAAKDDPVQLDRLRGLVSLLVSWVGEDNGVAVNLSEYIGELTAVAQGKGDVEWRDEFKKNLDQEINA
ncbi:hypothetical protein [Nocardia nova]|uniref:hypothetical protein n=1 Tax=Nocardia nova TaxID=37330 RepID=UPI0011B0BEAF|nr:hypothetical protein [Nocardia nova]